MSKSKTTLLDQRTRESLPIGNTILAQSPGLSSAFFDLHNDLKFTYKRRRSNWAVFRCSSGDKSHATFRPPNYMHVPSGTPAIKSNEKTSCVCAWMYNEININKTEKNLNKKWGGAHTSAPAQIRSVSGADRLRRAILAFSLFYLFILFEWNGDLNFIFGLSDVLKVF